MMKKLFGMICYRYVYAIPGEIGDELADGVVLDKNIHKAKKVATKIVERRNGKLVSVEKVQ